MRRFGVIGLGNFGMALAVQLAQMGQRVVTVDADPDKAREAQLHVEAALVADATDAAALHAMDFGRLDVAVVSMGADLYGCVKTVLHLSRMGVREIIAKAFDEDHGDILSRVGATRVVYPEKEMAERTADQLRTTNVLDHLVLAPGYSVAEIAPANAFIGRSLADLDLGRKYGLQVLAIKELVPERVTLIPRADQVLKDSDILVLMGDEAAIRRLEEI
jgi:trk system potassium uptake protein TrkA